MTGLFDYPKNAAFGRILPKNKIYEHAGANTALKDMFVRDVDQIVWRYKLAPETINLSATKSVAEIQVFDILLKTGKLDEVVLRAIDKVIPFPLIFELSYGGNRRAKAAYKRPSEADGTKWVLSEYFETDWVADNAARSPLPLALNLGALYQALLSGLMSEQIQVVSGKDAEDIQTRVDRMVAIRAKMRDVERIKARLARERQFNKRVLINADLRAAKLELERMTGPTAETAASSQLKGRRAWKK